MSSILPNTTQIPNVILDEWMARLSNTELRVVLVVARQTLGWIEDFQTGRRKDQDWISNYQLQLKTGMSANSIRPAVTNLINMEIIQALSSAGDILDSPMKRVMCGGRIFYRLDTKATTCGLLSGKLVDKQWTSRGTPPKFEGVKKRVSTKETVLTKYKNNNNKNKYIKKAEREGNLERLKSLKGQIFQKGKL